MRANHAAANHQNFGRQNTRNTAHQHAAPAIGLLQRPCAHLGGQPPRHFGHGGQQGQAAAIIGDCFIGNAGRARCQQIMGLLWVWGQMQIGEQNLPLAQARALYGLGFFYLHNHIGLCKHLFGRGDNLRACRDIIGIGKARAIARARFYHHSMAVLHRLARGIWGHANAKLLGFNLFGASDFHSILPVCICIFRGRIAQAARNCFDILGRFGAVCARIFDLCPKRCRKWPLIRS